MPPPESAGPPGDLFDFDLDKLPPFKPKRRDLSHRFALSDMRLQTGAAAAVLHRSISGGANLRDWSREEQENCFRFRTPAIDDGTATAEPGEGETLADLGYLLSCQDWDSVLIVSYILTRLIPSVADAEGGRVARFELSDIGQACGLIRHQGKAEKVQAAERVYRAIQAPARIVVKIERHEFLEGGKTKRLRPLNSALWSTSDAEDFLPEELPEQGRLCLEKQPPASIVIRLSSGWLDYLTKKGLSYHIGGIAALAGIPSGKPSSAMAKAIGLRVAELARLHAKAAMADLLVALEKREGDALPSLTRREWIQTFGPSCTDVPEKLRGRKVLEWYGALRELVGRGLLADVGEAARAAHGPPERSHRGWWEPWLNEPVHLVPGDVFLKYLKPIAEERGYHISDRIAVTMLRGEGRPRKIQNRPAGLPPKRFLSHEREPSSTGL